MRAPNYKVSHFEEIDSTNTQLVAAARAGAADGTVYWADFQSQGRGRLDRRWEAPAGSALMASVLLREPGLPHERLHLLTGLVALSLLEALAEQGFDGVSMKWPNDLLVGEGKLAGVLAEVVTVEPEACVVVGFGVNLTFAGPEDAGASSLAKNFGRSVEAGTLLQATLNRLFENRPMLRSEEGVLELVSKLSSSLATLGKAVRVESSSGEVQGIATGLSELGHIVIETATGPVIVETGDLRHLRTTN